MPPPSPRHIVAQQVLALALQEHTVGVRTWPEWWSGLEPVARDGDAVFSHLLADGFLDRDGDLAYIGPEAEKRFGRKHFSELMAVFTAPPEFVVLDGRREIGSVGDDVLLADSEGSSRVLLLAGRTWLVTHVDWKRRRCHVEPADLPGKARWSGMGAGLSFEISRGMRDVLLGSDPTGVTLSRRAADALTGLRRHHHGHVADGATVLHQSAGGDLHWWTWAGTAANRTLLASLPHLVDPAQRVGDTVVRLHHGTNAREASRSLSAFAGDLRPPVVNEHAIRGLKFSAALPAAVAAASVEERLADPVGARLVLSEPQARAVD